MESSLVLLPYLYFVYTLYQTSLFHFCVLLLVTWKDNGIDVMGRNKIRKAIIEKNNATAQNLNSGLKIKKVVVLA